MQGNKQPIQRQILYVHYVFSWIQKVNIHEHVIWLKYQSLNSHKQKT